ncbi:MAG TPA: hypothetical protein VFT22_07165 [Kofleriaceae bacterium]|nr:hypothetical protein [Kofleriaceae bacterium]
MIRHRRAGNGITTGTAPVEPICVREVEAPRPRSTTCSVWLCDIPSLAAAIEQAREDVRAHEQTEEYWKRVWGVDDRSTPT